MVRRSDFLYTPPIGPGPQGATGLQGATGIQGETGIHGLTGAMVADVEKEDSWKRRLEEWTWTTEQGAWKIHKRRTGRGKRWRPS